MMHAIDRHFIAANYPDYYGRPDTWPQQSDTERPHVRYAEHRCWMPGDSEEPPVSQVEAWRLWQDYETMMTMEQRAAESAAAMVRLRAMEAAVVLAAAITDDEAQAITEEIERWQRQD